MPGMYDLFMKEYSKTHHQSKVELEKLLHNLTDWEKKQKKKIKKGLIKNYTEEKYEKMTEIETLHGRIREETDAMKG